MPKVPCPSCGEEVAVKHNDEWGNCWSCGGRFSLNEDEGEEVPEKDEDAEDEGDEDEKSEDEDKPGGESGDDL